MGNLVKQTWVYKADSEQESERIINEYKNKQLEDGYSVINTKVDYKNKKDKKTGAIVEEYWITTVTVSYEA